MSERERVMGLLTTLMDELKKTPGTADAELKTLNYACMMHIVEELSIIADCLKKISGEKE